MERAGARLDAGVGTRIFTSDRVVTGPDGAVGITGGFGVRDNWRGDGLKPDEWRDSNVRVAGPAVWRFMSGHWAELLEIIPQNTVVRMVEGVTTLTEPDDVYVVPPTR